MAAEIRSAGPLRGVPVDHVLAEVEIGAEERFADPEARRDIGVDAEAARSKSRMDVIPVRVLMHRREAREPAEHIAGQGLGLGDAERREGGGAAVLKPGRGAGPSSAGIDHQ